MSAGVELRQMRDEAAAPRGKDAIVTSQPAYHYPSPVTGKAWRR